jgi:3'-phosphoadenosine 5'-phosphosulfate sulfotransferase (PAPS reductase)/FAD synthetase
MRQEEISMSSRLFPVADLLSQRQLFPASPTRSTPSSIAITPEISEMITAGAAVAIGVSGGKDSQACALRTTRHLQEIGHRGPRVLVHADLGEVEWRDSLPTCERLAAHLGLELIVVRREAGDMLARWRKRWENNVARYRGLSCVRLILPWSTPSMRFCTSELKVAPITSVLKNRFPTDAIINVSGIRRQESAKRSRMPVSAIESRLDRKDFGGMTWNPLIEWTIDDVLTEIRESGLTLHEAYTRYGSSRVSCAFCIMGSAHDLAASTTCAENQDIYRAMVELEAESSFAFQGTRWLADVAPHLLSTPLFERVHQAKRVAELRRKIEAEIPEHLLYTKGWPTSIPNQSEAALIASVRRRISNLFNLEAGYLTHDSVRARYVALLDAKHKRDQAACRGKRLQRSKTAIQRPEDSSFVFVKDAIRR